MQYLINHVTTNWKQFIDQEFKQAYLQQIDQLLLHTTIKVLPAKDKIFAAFNFFNVEDTKVVLIGQDPYPNPIHANGLAFSSNASCPIPASLKNIFKELNNDLHIERSNSDLTDWAQQGILLLNTTLTVYESQPCSHSNWGWKKLVNHTIEYLNQNTEHIVFVLLGQHAQQFTSVIDQTKHLVLCRSHPSPLAAAQANHHFFNTHLFSQINKYLLEKRAIQIKW